MRLVDHPIGRRRGAAATAALAGLLVAASTSMVSAQELPLCTDPSTASECQLPPWPDAAQRDAPSPFGVIDGAAWLDDAIGDAPPSGLDITAVGVGSVEIADAKPVRDADWLLKAGKAKRAIRPGRNVLVRVVLDRPLAAVVEGHAGVHVATDIDSSRSNNAPAGVRAPEQPFAGSEDVYSVTYATTNERTALLDSDLSGGWYEGDDPFAAAWATPTVLDILVRPEAFGAGFRVVTFTSPDEGGYDILSLESGPVPVDGRVGLRPACLEASISAEPFVVGRLVEGGQALRDVETPSAWRGGGSFAIDPATRGELAALIAGADEDGDGRIGLASSVNLFEDGAVFGQHPDLQLALAGERAQLALDVGLTRRGYEVLRQVELEPTGNVAADAWLARATEALTEAMPPFRSGKRGGTLVGEGIGTCVTELIAAPVAAAAS